MKKEGSVSRGNDAPLPGEQASLPAGYLPHLGGGCPVGAQAKVQVHYRQKRPYLFRTKGLASDYSWRHEGADGDIVGYRVLVEVPSDRTVVVPSATWKALMDLLRAQGIAPGFPAPDSTNGTTWRNGCDRTVPRALRYLAKNERPTGGSELFNTEHLLQLADEIEAQAKGSRASCVAFTHDADVAEALEKLHADCLASDFNEHWESYKRASDVLQRTKT